METKRGKESQHVGSRGVGTREEPIDAAARKNAGSDNPTHGLNGYSSPHEQGHKDRSYILAG